MEKMERPDLATKLYQAKAALNRYKQRLAANPQMKAQLEPIVEGYRELISDLEEERQQLQAQGSKPLLG